MNEAPKRIWAFEPDIFDNCSLWQDQPSPSDDTIEYIRADLVEAAIKRALEGAADTIEDYCSDMPDLAGHGHSSSLRDVIRALDPAQFIEGPNP